MFGMPVKDPETALASALSYWVFRCRDKNKSPAMGLKTWTFLQSSIQNSAIPAKTIDDYLCLLARKLMALHLSPLEWGRIIAPEQTILRAKRKLDGTLEIQTLDSDQQNAALLWRSWEDILLEMGIKQRRVLLLCRDKAFLIATYCRVRFEEDRALNQPETAIEVEVSDVV